MIPTRSTNEAVCVTGVPLKQVHRIIDAGLLGVAKRGDGRSRAVHRDALVGLKLAHDTMDLFTLDGRRRLVRYLLDHPHAGTARERNVSVDLRAMKSEVRRGLSVLSSARDAVECDEAVLSGAPCFKGTRIPVHGIADMLANGDRARGHSRGVSAPHEEEDRACDPLCAGLSPARATPPGPRLARAQAGLDGRGGAGRSIRFALKFLIDECLSSSLAIIARERGFAESTHVSWLVSGPGGTGF